MNVFKLEIYHNHYAFLGYYSNGLPSTYTLHELNYCHVSQ
jgi:hypothetical protein